MAKTDNELKYLEEKITKLISAIEREHFQFVMTENYEPGYKEEFPGWTEAWLKEQIIRLYTFITAYLEIKQMNVMLHSFKEKFESQINRRENLLKTELNHPEGEAELIVVTEFKRILEAYKDFGIIEDHVDETKRLKSILRNTCYILKKIDRPIDNEADIYNEIKWILGLYFPTARSKAKASFIQQFKTYNPDILIPEIKTAIEYKYIRTKKDNVDEYLDQIKVDSQNYVDDLRFENFIAVVYIADPSLATPEHIEQAWKAKQIPINWTLIVASGSAEII